MKKRKGYVSLCVVKMFFLLNHKVMATSVCYHVIFFMFIDKNIVIWITDVSIIWGINKKDF
jgi:hypothetical protein